MATIPFPIVGPTYTNRSLPVSSQVTRNFYIELNPQGNEPVSLQPFPGLKSFATTGAGVHRGSGIFNNNYYTITGTTLYKVTNAGSSTAIGTIDGTGRCVLESDGNNLVIANGFSRPYTYDGTTLTLGTDINLPEAATVTYSNRRVVYDGDDADLVFPDLDTPLTVNSLNILAAESEPDDVKAVIAHNSQVYAFGSNSIAPYYNTGTGNPPYAIITNSTIEQLGLHATYSIASNKDFVYFLGTDLIPYRVAGLAVQPIGNPAICQAIANYSETSDAFGVTLNFDSMSFYLLSFPTGNETWLYNEQSGLWTNLAYGTDGAQHLISSYNFIYGKHLVADRRNGNIYELDFDTYTDNSDVIQRRRDTVTIDGGTFGAPGNTVFMDRLELMIETGVSLVTATAQIMMEYSDDNGNTWVGSHGYAGIGDQGDYTYRVEWFGLGMFRRRMFRFTMTDPVKWVILSAHADVDLAYG
jgi:hypothetical protein